MSSWAVSACYPRRTFYPLSDGPSTQNHRITMTDFRLCSTCQSHSQASLCHCTLRRFLTSELTFARSVLFGRRPPQSNYPPYNVLMPDDGYQLDVKKNKRGISLVTPQKLTLLLQCLPPMLNMFFLTPM